MGMLKACCVCCTCLSVWAVIQLTFMGIFFHIETPILIHEAADEEEKNFDKFIEKTKKNYAANAINCWIAAAAYGMTLILSCGCIFLVNKKEKEKLRKLNNDDIICTPKETPLPQEVAAGAKLRKGKQKLDSHSDEEKKSPKSKTKKTRGGEAAPKSKTKKTKEGQAEPLPKKEKK